MFILEKKDHKQHIPECLSEHYNKTLLCRLKLKLFERIGGDNKCLPNYQLVRHFIIDQYRLHVEKGMLFGTLIATKSEKLIPRSKANNRSRIIMIKHITSKQKVEYGYLYTSLTWDALDVFEFYNGRQCIEAIIRTGKSYLNIKNLRTRNFYGISAFL